jgi:hypothetical protein
MADTGFLQGWLVTSNANVNAAVLKARNAPSDAKSHCALHTTQRPGKALTQKLLQRSN